MLPPDQTAPPVPERASRAEGPPGVAREKEERNEASARAAVAVMGKASEEALLPESRELVTATVSKHSFVCSLEKERGWEGLRSCSETRKKVGEQQLKSKAEAQCKLGRP